MNRPNKQDFLVNLNKSSLIKWGEYSKAQDEYIDELEYKLAACLDAESGYAHRIKILEMVRDVDKKVIHKYDIALENACERLENESMLCAITKKRYSPSLCDSCVDLCKNAWKKKLMEEVQNEHR